jgi:hypothetical protein
VDALRYFEQNFGDDRDWPAVVADVEDGSIRLRGRTDRVDIRPIVGVRSNSITKRAPQVSIPGMDDPIDAGKHLQLARYARSVRQVLGATVETGAAYWFVSGRGEFKQPN